VATPIIPLYIHRNSAQTCILELHNGYAPHRVWLIIFKILWRGEVLLTSRGLYLRMSIFLECCGLFKLWWASFHGPALPRFAQATGWCRTYSCDHNLCGSWPTCIRLPKIPCSACSPWDPHPRAVSFTAGDAPQPVLVLVVNSPSYAV
jgi:hypothetical protein